MSNVNIQFRRWVFTWSMPEYTPDRYTSYPISGQMLEKMLQTSDAKSYNFQLEIGHKAGVYHYQGRFSLSAKMVKSKLLERFNVFYSIKHLTLEPERDKLSSEAYCNKEDSRVYGTEVWFPKKYLGYDLPRFLGQDTKYFWQTQMDSVIYEKSSRRIVVLMDTEGGMGKSSYIKTCCFRNPSDHALITVLGTPISINAALIAMGPRSVYHVDLNRSYPKSSLSDTMIVLESLKNGMLSSSMYGKPTVMYMDVPTIIVYTNLQFYREDLVHLSRDRWDFRIPEVTYSGTGHPTVMIAPIAIDDLPHQPPAPASGKK